jgi:nucleoside-diphosphate-sugar epimerase
MERVAVTGGAGFIGSHIAKRLQEGGGSVKIIDDYSSGSEQNLSDLGVREKVVVGDLREYDFARDSLKDIDTVFHFAAEVGSVQYLHGSAEGELHALQANLSIDTNVFRACIENGISKIVYASSVSVYPKHLQMTQSSPFKEEDSAVVEPEGGYGWSKYVAEKQLEMITGAKTGVGRIFHAYGKNIYLKPDKSQVIASLVRKAIDFPEEGFVVWGDGSQKRCFVYIDDVIDALFLLSDYVGKNGKLTINIGNVEETSISDLASKIIRISKKEIPLNFDPSKPTGVIQRKPSLEKIKKTLGWSPKTKLDEGLSVTYDWASERLKTDLA